MRVPGTPLKYRVWPKGSPERAVILDFTAYQDSDPKPRTRNLPTVMRIRGRACSEGHFSWGLYTSLRVKKLVMP